MVNLLEGDIITCNICNKQVKGSRGLSAHLEQSHNTNAKDYTIQYLLNNDIPKCKCGCGEPVNVLIYKYNDFIRYHNSNNRRKVSHNPDDWKIECFGENCTNIIIHNNRDAYRGALKRICRGYNQYCLECRYKYKKPNLPQIYSRNTEDWRFPCEGETCNKILQYNTLGSYCAALKKHNKGIKLKCNSCSQMGRKLTEDKRKIRADKFKETWKLKSDDEIEKYKKKLSDSHLSRWSEMSPEDRKLRCDKMTQLHLNMSEEQKIEIGKKISKNRRKWFEEISTNDVIYRCNYNKVTIPYIIDVLNVRYNVEFRHAESVNGEFKIYDHDLKTLYFADAYAPELNIWIEFDEPYHFVGNALRQKCIDREERIRYLLPGVEIHRIFFNKNLH